MNEEELAHPDASEVPEAVIKKMKEHFNVLTIG